MLRGLTIDCVCGESVNVEGLPDELHDEDVLHASAVCKCGERYRVKLSMDIRGKEPHPHD